MGVINSEEVLQILTRECRDLLDNLAAKTTANGIQFTHPTIVDLSAEERNQIIRDHFAMDNSGHGITIEEWLPDINEDQRIEIVDKVLAGPEYQED